MIKKIALFAIILFGIFANVSFATDANKDEKTILSSESAVCRKQNNENICSYIGNAKLNQGTTTSLQAEQITIHKIASGKINKIVASGKHSHYSTTMNNNQKPINADADTITIYPEKSVLVLEGKGEVVTDKDKYSGPHIEYKFK